jgi:hypothetical protein
MKDFETVLDAIHQNLQGIQKSLYSLAAAYDDMALHLNQLTRAHRNLLRDVADAEAEKHQIKGTIN